MLKKIVIGAAGTVVAILIVSAIPRLISWIDGLLAPPVPSGAIIAFQRPCAEIVGWDEFEDGAGKFLLGVGEGILRPRGPHRPTFTKDSDIELTLVKLNDQGGEERHVLSLDEIPAHQHRVEFDWGYDINSKDDDDHRSPARIDVADGKPYQDARKEHKGALMTKKLNRGVTAHNNMPPYIALYFCRNA